MPEFQVSPEILVAICGALLSILFSYIPGLSTAFAALSTEAKRLIMAGILLVTAVVIFILNCYSILQAGVVCNQAGAVQLVWYLILAIMANQSVFALTPQTQAVKDAKID
jgi:hypothetical protein